MYDILFAMHREIERMSKRSCLKGEGEGACDETSQSQSDVTAR